MEAGQGPRAQDQLWLLCWWCLHWLKLWQGLEVEPFLGSPELQRPKRTEVEIQRNETPQHFHSGLPSRKPRTKDRWRELGSTSKEVKEHQASRPWE